MVYPASLRVKPPPGTTPGTLLLVQSRGTALPRVYARRDLPLLITTAGGKGCAVLEHSLPEKRRPGLTRRGPIPPEPEIRAIGSSLGLVDAHPQRLGVTATGRSTLGRKDQTRLSSGPRSSVSSGQAEGLEGGRIPACRTGRFRNGSAGDRSLKRPRTRHVLLAGRSAPATLSRRPKSKEPAPCLGAGSPLYRAFQNGPIRSSESLTWPSDRRR